MKPFLSHIYRDQDDIVIAKKPLARHISAMLALVSASRLHDGKGSTDSAFPDEKMLRAVIQLHDLGKYTEYFQIGRAHV